MSLLAEPLVQLGGLQLAPLEPPQGRVGAVGLKKYLPNRFQRHAGGLGHLPAPPVVTKRQ
jgi:hypothetical protein